MKQMVLNVWRWCAVAVTLMLSIGALQADVVFSSFDNPPGTSFVSSRFYEIIGSSFGDLTDYAFPFLSSGNYDVTQVDMVLSGISTQPGSNSLEVGIYSDSSGLPDTLLGSLYAVDPGTLDDPAVVTLSPISGVSLQAGQNYWLAVEAGSDNTLAGWYVNNSAASGAYSNDGSTWNAFSNVQAYFDVVGDASSTPEPGTLVALLLGLGAIGLVGYRQRLSQQ